jgi:hypothetical protein
VPKKWNEYFAMNEKYLAKDWRSLEMHRLVADRLKNAPSLINQAIENIERWKKQNTSTPAEEWLPHIHQGLDHLISLLLSETDEGQRLSLSPFVGDSFITQEERAAIFERFKMK